MPASIHLREVTTGTGPTQPTCIPITIRIRKVDTDDVVAALDVEATRAVINITRSTIRTKIEGNPTIPVFYTWRGSRSASDCDTTDSPYSLIWTRTGPAHDLESAEANVPPKGRLLPAYSDNAPAVVALLKPLYRLNCSGLSLSYIQKRLNSRRGESSVF